MLVATKSLPCRNSAGQKLWFLPPHGQEKGKPGMWFLSKIPREVGELAPDGTAAPRASAYREMGRGVTRSFPLHSLPERCSGHEFHPCVRRGKYPLPLLNHRSFFSRQIFSVVTIQEKALSLFIWLHNPIRVCHL